MGLEQDATCRLLRSIGASEPLPEQVTASLHEDQQPRSSLRLVSLSILKGLGDFTLKSLSAVKQMHPSLSSGLRNWQFSNGCPGWQKAESNQTFRRDLAQRNSIIWTGAWPDLWLNAPTGRRIKNLHSGPAAVFLIFKNGLLEISFLDKSIPPVPYMSEMLTLLLYQVSAHKACKWL